MEQVPISLPFVGGVAETQEVQHPIAPLTASEIIESSRLIREAWPSHTNLHFKVVTLQEPSKVELLPFLAAEHQGRRLRPIERRSLVVYYIRNTVSEIADRWDERGVSLRPKLILNAKDKLHEAIVNLTRGRVERNVRLGPNIHSNADGDEIVLVENVALEDEGVKAEIAKLKLPEGTVLICDPWIYGMSFS
jgi:primary-amine oxidase